MIKSKLNLYLYIDALYEKYDNEEQDSEIM